MARVWLCTDGDDARLSRRVVDKLFGLPVSGAHFGSGTHADLAVERGPGWTQHHFAILRNQELGTHAVPVDAALDAAIVDPEKRALLTADELAYLDAKYASSADLAEWDREDQPIVERIERASTDTEGTLSAWYEAMNPLDDGAKGLPGVDDRVALLSTFGKASAAKPAEFTRNHEFSGSSVGTVTAPMVFAPGGSIEVRDGVFQFASAINASPYQQIFKTMAAASEFRIRARRKYYANWWPGVDIFDRINNMVKGMRHFASAFNHLAPICLAVAPDAYEITTPCNLANWRGQVTVDFSGCLFYASPGRDKVALDTTGSTGIFFPGGIPIQGMDCGIGWLEARPRNNASPIYGGSPAPVQAGASSGKHLVINPQLTGYFAIGAHVNFAAEESKLFGGRIENGTAFASTTLAAPISADTTTIPVATATGFHDPLIGAGPCYGIIHDIAPPTGGAAYRDYEIIKYTGKLTDALTNVERGAFGSTKRAWVPSPTLRVEERGLHSLYLGCDVPAHMLPWINGPNTISPHSEPGNDVADESSTGYSIIGTQIKGAPLLGSVYVDGFANVDIVSGYITGGPTPCVVVDPSRRAVPDLHLDNVYTHGGPLGNAQYTVEIKGSSQAMDMPGLSCRGMRGVSAGIAVFKIGECTLWHPILEWNDPLGLVCDPEARLQDPIIKPHAKTSQIVLPTSSVNTNLRMGRCNGGEIYCDEAQLTRAHDMRGSKLYEGGQFDRQTGVYTPAKTILYDVTEETRPGILP